MLDGTICHAQPKGTSLESFSSKPRLVLLAFHDDVHAFVYPITTTKTQGAMKIDADGANGYLILKSGLFRIPLAAITETNRRWFQFSRIKNRIERDLETLEERSTRNDDPLMHRGLEGLRGMRESMPAPEAPKKPEPLKPRQLSDEELFQKALEDFETS